MKTCSRCGVTWPLEGFHVLTKSKSGRQHWCKACHAELRKKNYEENPERQRDHAHRWYLANMEKHKAQGRAAHLRRKFRLTIEEYDALLASQGGGCAICGATHEETRRLAVDHCHETGEIRGILCDKCNRLLGIVSDDTERLEKAVLYLRR